MTLITLKTLQQQSFKIDIGDNETVKKLKEKIESEKGAENFPVAGQKLIYAGKILEDEKTVKDCNIDTKNFIVVMVTKPKSQPKTAETKPVEAAAPAPTQPAETKEAPKEEEKKEEEACAAATPAATATPAASATPAATAMDTSTPQSTASTTATSTDQPMVETEEASSNSLVTGTEYELAITNLVSLGFTRDQCVRAMSKAFNYPDRAAEYLLSGDEAVLHGGEADTDPVAPGPPGSVGVAGGEENPLAFLRDQQQFQSLRQLVQTSPEALPQLLQQMRQDNPELLSLINQHQHSFLHLLNEPYEGQGSGGGSAGGAVVGSGAGTGAGTGTGTGTATGTGTGTGTGAGLENVHDVRIQISPQDKAAIDRLIEMGFLEHNCIEAYFACEKDEQKAANFLMNNMDD